MTQDYYGGGVSYTPIASLFLRKKNSEKSLEKKKVWGKA